MFTVQIESLGESYPNSSEQTLLAGMERLGRSGIPVGCRGGGCGVCKVHITEGRYSCKKMSRAHVTVEEQAKGYVLACRCQPLSDIRLTVVGKMKAAVFGDKQRPSPAGEAGDGNRT